MWRQIHRWPAVFLGLLLIFLSVTGSILSIEPVLRSFDRHVQPTGDMTVGDLLRLSDKRNPNFVIDRVRIDYSGRVMVRGTDGGGAREVPINLKSGQLGRVDRTNPFMELVRTLHASLGMGASARPVTLGAAMAMLVLIVSGAFLLVRRLGGWSKFFLPIRGRGFDKWHSYVGRLALVPLFVTVLSGCWMALVANGLLPSGANSRPVPPETTAEAEAVPALSLSVFDSYHLADLTELTFPVMADWWDVYTIRVGGTLTFIDRTTGAELGAAAVPTWTRALDLFTMLHTGQGAATWGAVAGLFSLSVPFFTTTGVIIWLRRRTPRPRGMVKAPAADIAILVGSETGSTWGFATHLAERLRDEGQQVFVGPMNATYHLRPEALMLVLAATYGDGAPPSGASQFLTRLPLYKGARAFAVLGFGDKSFPAYCAFADACQAALVQSGRGQFLPMADINRRSSQAFATWGRDLAVALDLPGLALEYVPPRPRTRPLVLESREEFGALTSQRSSILRFRVGQGRLFRFEAGDLLAVVPPTDPVARYYSLASGAREGFVELCVSLVEGGVCSSLLLGLKPGESIDAYVEANPDFRPARRAPTIMIGAGAGIAPFAGMIRINRKRPIDLFFGLRHPDSDFFWQRSIEQWRLDGRLAGFYPAFSRHDGRTYVQDRIRNHDSAVAERLAQGATVMVCGSVRMAREVAREIDAIAGTLGSSLAELRRQGRYLEDIY